MKKKSQFYINELISRYPVLKDLEINIKEAIKLLRFSSENNGKYLICGNGGSSSDSDHMVGELMKSFNIKRQLGKDFAKKLQKKFPNDSDFLINNLEKGIPALSLSSHVALLTAFSNDVNSELVFAQQVLGYGKKNDVLISISTSGKSKNIIYAAKIAKVMGINVISLTGKNGGELKDVSDVIINVPEVETYKVQELHLPIYHVLCLVLENELFGEE